MIMSDATYRDLVISDTYESSLHNRYYQTIKMMIVRMRILTGKEGGGMRGEAYAQLSLYTDSKIFFQIHVTPTPALGITQAYAFQV